MSKFDEFADTARKVATKAVNETVRITDEAASKLKIKAEEAKLCEKYEKLGRAACGYFEELGAYPEDIAKVMDEINAVKEKISSLEGELADKKTKYAEKKSETGAKFKAENEAKTEEKTEEDEPSAESDSDN